MNKIGIKCDLCGTDTGYFKYFCLKCWVEQVEQKIMQLEAENRHLRAVVEAAQELFDKCHHLRSYQGCRPKVIGLVEKLRQCREACPIEKLEQALAALEEVEK